MQRSFSFCFAAIVVLTASLCAAADSIPRVRVTTSFDPGWRFLQGDASSAEQAAFADGSWQRVDVPHDWAVEGAYDQNAAVGRGGGYKPSGVSWYRKQFILPADHAQRKVFIEFDGVMANSDVWINGQHLGKRPYGYVSFGYELTPHLKFGEGNANVLAVRTDTSVQPASRWYTGQGIYRHVRLVSTNPVHLGRWGVFVTTPQITADQSVVRVQSTVVNQSNTSRQVRVQATILGPDGQPVQSGETETQTIAAGQSGTFEQDITVANPRLWNLDQPNLYRAVTRVVSDGTTLDDEVTTFGIRHIEFKPETGFWLNGRNIKVNGMCLHHDGGAVGAAVPIGIWERRIKALKQFGANAIRCAHNPPSPELLNACDRLGMLVMNEFFDAWTVGKPHAEQGYNLYFSEWGKTDLRDTVLRDRNHPSIILWSTGNEIHDTPKEELAKSILRGLVDAVHELDPTRPVTQALFRPNNSNDFTNGLADMLDVIGVNYRDSEMLRAWQQKPTRKIIGTEQGHEPNIWRQTRDNPQHAGQFIWAGVDYLGEADWPFVTSSAGILDRTLAPKHRAYQRLSWWGTEPVIHVARVEPGLAGSDPRRRFGYDRISNWTPMDPTSYTQADIEVYSNCDEVEVFVNDQPVGSKPVPADALPATFQITYEPGTIRAVGKKAGQVVATHELRTSGKPARLLLSADVQKLPQSWEDVCFAAVTVVDENGVQCAWSEDPISFSISGPGVIAAVDNGNRSSNEPFKATQRKAFMGRAIAILRSTASSGQITLNASAPGLQSASITIEAAPVMSR